jgi:hypothetical protein
MDFCLCELTYSADREQILAPVIPIVLSPKPRILVGDPGSLSYVLRRDAMRVIGRYVVLNKYVLLTEDNCSFPIPI